MFWDKQDLFLIYIKNKSLHDLPDEAIQDDEEEIKTKLSIRKRLKPV